MIAMVFDPNKFLNLAIYLRIDSNRNYDTESKYRTVIGRAYYAAFLFSKKFLEEEKHRRFSKDKSVHEQVV
jgi:hypothetical protein